MLYKRHNQKETEEFRFLSKFIDSGYLDRFKSAKYNLTLIHEPFTEVGYADLVCVKWRKPESYDWTNERSKLVKNDVKILHHLYNCRIFKSPIDIVNELGFSQKNVHNTLLRLSDSELIFENKKKDKVKIKPLNEIFFVREIVAIEAKLRDWKGALRQSFNNTSFSSQSFALFPEKTINNNLVNTYKNTSVGVLSFESSCHQVIKPKRNQIPTNIASWYFNEFVGRNNCLTC